MTNNRVTIATLEDNNYVVFFNAGGVYNIVPHPAISIPRTDNRIVSVSDRIGTLSEGELVFNQHPVTHKYLMGSLSSSGVRAYTDANGASVAGLYKSGRVAVPPGFHFNAKYNDSTNDSHIYDMDYISYSDRAIHCHIECSQHEAPSYDSGKVQTTQLRVFYTIVVDKGWWSKPYYRGYSSKGGYLDYGYHTYVWDHGKSEPFPSALILAMRLAMLDAVDQVKEIPLPTGTYAAQTTLFTGFSFDPDEEFLHLDRWFRANEWRITSGCTDVTQSMLRDLLDGQNLFTSNSIALATDMKEIGESIRSTLSLIASPYDPKAWASEWMALRFTDRLTLKDSKEFLSAIRSRLSEFTNRFSGRQSRARESGTVNSKLLQSSGTWTSNARLICEFESYNTLMSAVKKLLEWDVWPTLENSWDMIPFSFVVDWFLNLSTILSNVDRLVYQQYLRVRYLEHSCKTIYSHVPVNLKSPFSNNLKAVHYMRQYMDSIPDIRIMDGWALDLPSPINLVDSAALLVQFR